MTSMLDRVIALLITFVYWTLSRTWRVTYRGTLRHDETSSPRIYAHWHGDELLLIGAHSGRGMAVLSSQSRDGTRLALILKWLGYQVVRGSSSRSGAAGLKGLVDRVKKNSCDASLAVDGPRGPIHRVKPGVVKLAQLCGAPLLPGVASARSRFVFRRAWNRCFLPLPFSRCAVLYGDPIFIARDASDEEVERVRVLLEESLAKLKLEADRASERSTGHIALRPAN